MNKVAIYARVSTVDKQDYKRQIEELTDKIKRDGYSEENIDVFSESISGYKFDKERPEMSKLNRIIEEDNDFYTRIYVSEISRIGRKPKKIRDIIEFWNDAGVDLYIHNIGQNTLQPNGDRNTVVNTIIHVLIEFAHSEGELFKQRSRSGLFSSAKAGRAGGGKYLPYGYRRDKHKMLVIDDSEADIIERIFKLYRKGNGTKVISGILNNEKVPTRTNKALKGKELNFKIKKKAEDIQWSDKQVHDFLKNTIYKGERRFKGEILKAPAIVPAELFDECTEIRKNKTHKNHLTIYEYLLKNKITCGCCGRNYFAKFKPHTGGDKVYICSSRLKTKGNCGNAGVNISLIESAIYNEIISSTSILKYINNKDEVKKRMEEELEQLKNRISTNERLYNESRKKQKTLLKYALSVSLDSEVLESENATLVAEENRLEEKLIHDRTQLRKIEKGLKKQNDVGTTAEMLKNARTNRSELRAIFHEIIDNVIINVIDKDTILANVFLSIDEVVLPTSLRLFLNTKGIRKPLKEFGYQPMPGRNEAKRYHKNILKTPIHQIQEELHIIKENLGFLETEYINIREENVLTIPTA
ncbi:recombinase family protein [Zunongwangia sp. SCSIO 43204]|uniref:recombinase family protein n=1 Tax=Zunongwangia sp. SCSIO 43204 TaxID=2779359 RepID=UPI001CA88993|nr:recombinase family protein [Zunongwangia sp. SCSIO 43204]UAB83877.1 recombinase family protein [Zunongwangia sp. SCSIO 43204]